MKFDLFGIFSLVGALNGFIVVIYLLFSKDDKRQARYFLAGLIGGLSFDMFETFLSSQRILAPANTDVYGFAWVFTLGPSLYFSIKTSLYSKRINRKTMMLHYSVAVIDLLISIILFSLREKPFFSETYSSSLLLLISEIHLGGSRILNIVAFWVYFIFSSKELKQFQKSILLPDSNVSEAEKEIIVKWSSSLLKVSFFIALVWTLTLFGVVLFNKRDVLFFYYPLEFLLAIGSYWVGFTMYHRIKVVFLSEENNRQRKVKGLTTGEFNKNLEIISNAMIVDKVYLDPELNVTKLSAHINLPPKLISATLNQHLEIGFNEYINSFRVEEVKQRLIDPKNKNLTIIAIAFDSGFNSVTTFQRVFKKQTGLTPKEFLSKNQK